MDVEVKKKSFGSNLKDILHLKEHDEGIGDGKADAEYKYEIVDDEDLVRVKCHQCTDAMMTYMCHFHSVAGIAVHHLHYSNMHLHQKF